MGLPEKGQSQSEQRLRGSAHSTRTSWALQVKGPGPLLGRGPSLMSHEHRPERHVCDPERQQTRACWSGIWPVPGARSGRSFACQRLPLQWFPLSLSLFKLHLPPTSPQPIPQSYSWAADSKLWQRSRAPANDIILSSPHNTTCAGGSGASWKPSPLMDVSWSSAQGSPLLGDSTLIADSAPWTTISWQTLM